MTLPRTGIPAGFPKRHYRDPVYGRWAQCAGALWGEDPVEKLRDCRAAGPLQVLHEQFDWTAGLWVGTEQCPVCGTRHGYLRWPEVGEEWWFQVTEEYPSAGGLR